MEIQYFTPFPGHYSPRLQEEEEEERIVIGATPWLWARSSVQQIRTQELRLERLKTGENNLLLNNLTIYTLQTSSW